MLIAFIQRNNVVEIRDTDETPAAYLLTIEERELIARQHAEHVKTKGANRICHVSMNPLTRPDVRGIGQEAAMRALFDHLSAHKKFARYTLQQMSIEAANADVIGVEADKVKDAAAPAIVNP